MTDILLELEALEPKIAGAKRSQAFGAAAGKARIPVEQAPKHAALLERLLSCAHHLDALGDAVLRQRFETAIDKAEEVGGALEEAADAADLEAAAHDYPMVANALVRVVDGLKVQWSQIVARDFADLPAVGTLLAKIPGAEAIGGDLSAIGEEAQALADGDPSAEVLSERAPALRERRTRTLEAMSAFTGEPEVDAFLAAVTRQQATLAMVTPMVWAWLKDKGALDAFRVRG